MKYDAMKKDDRLLFVATQGQARVHDFKPGVKNLRRAKRFENKFFIFLKV